MIHSCTINFRSKRTDTNMISKKMFTDPFPNIPILKEIHLPATTTGKIIIIIILNMVDIYMHKNAIILLLNFFLILYIF